MLLFLIFQGGRGGRIIVTASTAGFIAVDYDGTREWAGYCAAKTANIAVTRMFNNAKTGETEVSLLIII